MDTTDRQLLKLLQLNNRRPLRDLAEELGISAPTCLRRLRRLESSGVITGHAARVEPRVAGFGVTAYVEVSLANPSGAQMAAFERRIARCPEVLECSELAGDVDYLLRVVARDMEAFGEFGRRELANDKRIAAYRSLIVLKQAKKTDVLPIALL